MPVGLAALEPAALLEPREDPLVRLLLREPLEALGDHPPVGADHRQRRKLVVAADLEVHRVVPRRDLDRARAELRLDAGVRDHRHAPLDHRDDHLPADGVRVARVVGMRPRRPMSARIVDGRTVAIVIPPSPSANG